MNFSFSNTLASLKSALSSLQSTLSNLFASLSGGVKSQTPSSTIGTTSQKTAQTVQPPSLSAAAGPIGPPHPLPGGGTSYLTNKGEVQIPKGVKLSPLPASFMPGTDVVSYYELPKLAANEKYRESVLKTQTSPIASSIPATFFNPNQITSQNISTSSTQTTPTSTPSFSTTGASQGGITTSPKTTSQPTVQPTGEAGYSPTGYSPTGYSSAIPSMGYSSTPSKYGITGAVTPLSTASQSLISLPYTLPEEEKKKYTIKSGDTLSKISKELGVSIQDILKENPQITNPNLIQAGGTIQLPSVAQSMPSVNQPQGIPSTTSNFQPNVSLPQSQVSLPQPNVSLPQVISPEGVVDLSAAQEGINKITELMKSPLAMQTASEFNSYLENTKNILLQSLQVLNPLPENPIPKPETIAETPEELAKLKDTNPIDYDSIMTKYGVPDIIKQLENMQNQIQAETELGNKMIEQIQSDPDFPRALAERRIAQVQKANQTNLQALQTKYNFLVDLYNIKLGLAKQEISQLESAYTRQQTEIERQRDNARQMIQQLISTGAISDLSDAELQQWADSAGYTLDSLKAIRKAVKSGNDLKIAQAQANLEKTIQSTQENLNKTTKSTTITSATGANYNTRLKEEINNLYNGRYGTEWARERVINILQREFPNQDVAGDIYNRVPDNWDKLTTSKTISSGSSSSNNPIDELYNNL